MSLLVDKNQLDDDDLKKKVILEELPHLPVSFILHGQVKSSKCQTLNEIRCVKL